MAALFSLALAACGDGQGAEAQTRTVADLQQLPAGEYAAPYDKTAKVGGTCKLVTYSYTTGGDIPVMQRTVYEYVLYDRAPQPIDKARAASADDIEDLLNNPPRICE